jgi:Domain of unknown function (DUF6265)
MGNDRPQWEAIMKLKHRATAAAALLLTGAAPASNAIDKLAWMSGTWDTGDARRWTEEHWTRPRAGMMMGGSRTGDASTVKEFEYLRIAPDDNGQLTYWASPAGRPAVGFKMTQGDSSSATFENPQHDFPQRISYRRERATMTATISDIKGGNAQSWVYRRRGD